VMNLAMVNGFSEVGFVEMNEQEMMSVDGGIDWESVANFAWIAGSACATVPVPGARIASLLCNCFAGGYYLGKAFAD